MSNEMVHIGNSAYVNTNKIRIMIPADATKVRRIMKRKGVEQDSAMFWNATGELETRALIILDDGMLVTSCISSNVLSKRVNQKNILEVQVDD